MIACSICGGAHGWQIPHNTDPAIEVWRAEAGDSAPYYWTLCAGCANAYPSVPPNPKVLAKYWDENRRVNELDGSDGEAIWQRRLAMARVGASRSYQVFAPLHEGPPGKILDIACGLGETVDAFGRQGWHAEGVDVDAHTKPFHERLGVSTRIGRIEDEAAQSIFDIVHIAHAIYFITDPMKFLERARQQLAPGGLFCVVISDFLAATDPSLPGYAHTFYPCAASMRFALARAGLEPVLTRTWGGSIYIAARAAEPRTIPINSRVIYAMYQTKPLRHAVIGRPNLALRRIAKRALARGRS